MFTPDKQSANKIEKVMLLALWANEFKERFKVHNKTMILAGLGRPTYPINRNTIKSYLNYWNRLDAIASDWHENPESKLENPAIDYGDPRGDIEARAIMARCMTQWYDSEVQARHILFTIGGIGGLRAIFDTFNSHFDTIPGYRIITPFPHYSVYANDTMHQLHPINVMDNPGYKLTASSLQHSIERAYQLAETDKGLPKALLLCNPSNPLGNIIDETEMTKIVMVLRDYPDLFIIFDEAYAEMAFVPLPSFLKIAPDLKDRTLILRSATKALSAAGERMAILIVFNVEMMNELLNKNINYFIHAPRSSQIAYAETMAFFDKEEQQNLACYYQKKVIYVLQRLAKMGASMPDPNYTVEATFYAMGDFSDMYGLPMPQELQEVFGTVRIIETDEELAYYLLYNDAVMVTPLSYFGLKSHSGFLRITCSASDTELADLMNRLESRLIFARKIKKHALMANITEHLQCLKDKNALLYDLVTTKLMPYHSDVLNCLELKKQIISLEKIEHFVIDGVEIIDEQSTY